MRVSSSGCIRRILLKTTEKAELVAFAFRAILVGRLSKILLDRVGRTSRLYADGWAEETLTKCRLPWLFLEGR